MAVKQLTYAFEVPVNGITKVKFTVGTITVAGLGEYTKFDTLARKIMIEEAGGTDPAKLDDDAREELDPMIGMRYGVRRQWARVLPTIRAVHAVDGEETERRISLEDLGWHSLRDLDDLPVDLLDALHRYAVMVNPRVFQGAYIPEEEGDGSKKKTGLIQVS